MDCRSSGDGLCMNMEASRSTCARASSVPLSPHHGPCVASISDDTMTLEQLSPEALA